MTNEEINALLTEEQKSALQRTVAEAVAALTPIVAECIRALTPIIQEFNDRFQAAFGAEKAYPNKRVVWLAYNHKKERTRKKNYRRILRGIEKRTL